MAGIDVRKTSRSSILLALILGLSASAFGITLSPPTSPTARAVSPTEVDLDWSSPNTQREGTYVDRSIDGVHFTMPYATVANRGLSYRDLSVSEGTRYYYRFRDFKNSDVSPASAIVSATTPQTVPIAPSGLAASPLAPTQIRATWTDGSFNESGFRIERSSSATGPWSTAGSVGANVTTFVDAAASENTTYFYRVAAFNTAGERFSTTANAKTPQSVPIAPSGLTATATSASSINLSWTDSAFNESGYRIERSPNGSTWSLIATTAANTRAYGNSGLSESTTYFYRVQAFNTAGGAYSSSASATTLATIPIAPSSLSAGAASSSQINLAWTDNSFNETGFVIQRAPSSAGPWGQVGTAAAGSRNFSDAGLAPSTTYFYRAAAFNAAGNSAWSNTASTMTLAATATRTPTAAPPTATQTRTPTPAGPTSTRTKTPTMTPTRTVTSGGTTATPTRTPTRTPTSLPATPTRTSTPAPPTATPTRTSTPAPPTATPTRTPTAVPPTGTPTLVGQLPVPPSNLNSAPMSSSQISLAWTDNSTNELGFKVERAPATGGPWTQIGVTTQSGYGDSGLPASTPFYYRVRAYNTAGDSGYTNVSGSTTMGSTGAHLWSTHFGGPQMAVDLAQPAGVAVDGSGAAIVVGYLKGNVDFGGGPLTSAGAGDVYLVKYDSAGRYLWSQRFGGTLDDRPKGVAVDAGGNIYITGHFRDTVSFGGGSLVSDAFLANGFLAKYSASGGHLWSRRLATGGSTETGNALAIDAGGNVVVAASHFGTADYGGGPLATVGGEDVALVKFSATGAHVWSKSFGGTSADTVTSVAVDRTTSEIAITGNFGGSTNLGGTVLTSAGGNDIFLAKYSSAGAHSWSRRWGGTFEDKGADVTIDELGNVIATGNFTGNVDFGGGPIANAGDGQSSDIFLVKISSTGVHLWSKGFGSSLSLSETGTGVDTDTGENVILTGAIVGPIDFGGGVRNGDGYYNVFLAKFNSAGVHSWSKRYLGGGGHGTGRAAAFDGAGNVFGTGDYDISENFGGATMLSPGSFDTYLVKLGP